MEKFRAAVDEFLICLWDSDVAAEASKFNEEFRGLLSKVGDHAAARKLASKKHLHMPLSDRDMKSAKAFLNRIYNENDKGEKRWREKRAYFQNLRKEALAIAAVLYSGQGLLDHAVETVVALSEGAEKIATWSPWLANSELDKLVQEYKPPPVVSAIPTRLPPPITSAIPTRPPPSAGHIPTVTSSRTLIATRPILRQPAPPEGRLALTCFACGAQLRLRLVYEQEIDGRPA